MREPPCLHHNKTNKEPSNEPTVALITGCSSGIGRALADAFKQAGYSVCLRAQ